MLVLPPVRQTGKPDASRARQISTRCTHWQLPPISVGDADAVVVSRIREGKIADLRTRPLGVLPLVSGIVFVAGILVLYPTTPG